MKPFILFFTFLILFPVHAARVALVIGNSAYSARPLENPVNDARAMSSKLQSLGFTVIKKENLRQREVGGVLRELRSKIKAGDEVLVFYAGHGLQVKGVNYLPVVDADIQSEDDVPLQSLSLDQILTVLDESKAGVKLLFLDACRDNPFARSFRSSAGGDLGRISSAPSGTLIHYATRPGSLAADGKRGGNGLYTENLLKHIAEPNLAIESMHKRVSAGVRNTSLGKQEPWTEGQLNGEYYFRDLSVNNVGTTINPQAIAPIFVLPIAQPQIVDRFRVSANGDEVFDPKTRLMWQRCSVGQNWNGSVCEGKAREFTFSEAQALNQNGWIVPTIRELSSLIYCSTGKTDRIDDLYDGDLPIINSCAGEYVNPTINQTAFPDTPNSLFWSSSRYKNFPDNFLGVSFHYGDVKIRLNTAKNYVRLVRFSP